MSTVSRMGQLIPDEVTPITRKGCGSCMHFIPTHSVVPKKITRGKGKGHYGYWKCSCKESSYCGKCRVADDGARCPNYSDRYADIYLVDEWVKKCVKPKTEKPRRSKPGRPASLYRIPRKI